jgi:hypothetical protein
MWKICLDCWLNLLFLYKIKVQPSQICMKKWREDIHISNCCCLLWRMFLVIPGYFFWWWSRSSLLMAFYFLIVTAFVLPAYACHLHLWCNQYSWHLFGCYVNLFNLLALLNIILLSCC